MSEFVRPSGGKAEKRSKTCADAISWCNRCGCGKAETDEI